MIIMFLRLIAHLIYLIQLTKELGLLLKFKMVATTLVHIVQSLMQEVFQEVILLIIQC